MACMVAQFARITFLHGLHDFILLLLLLLSIYLFCLVLKYFFFFIHLFNLTVL